MVKRYELIDHTADIGLRAKGKDLPELFSNAAYGMFAILADLKNVRTKKSLVIEIEAPNIEELFLSWLRELLYQYNAKEILLKKFAINRLENTALSALVWGEERDTQRHNLKAEIKAVTFHQLKVEKVDNIWQGQVIFDV